MVGSAHPTGRVGRRHPRLEGRHHFFGQSPHFSPCTTSSQGWVLPQEGDQQAASRILLMTSRGTASGLKAQMLFLVFRASKSSRFPSLYLRFSWDINK